MVCDKNKNVNSCKIALCIRIKQYETFPLNVRHLFRPTNKFVALKSNLLDFGFRRSQTTVTRRPAYRSDRFRASILCRETLEYISKKIKMNTDSLN